MRESQFHSEIKESFLHYYPTGLYLKIPDMPRGPTSRFIPMKPFDIILFIRDKAIMIEAKLLKNGKTSVNLGDRPGQNMLRQLRELSYLSSLNHESYLAVEVVGKFRGMAEKIKKCYFFTPDSLIELLATQKFDVPMVMRNGIEIPRKGAYWDLSVILGKSQQGENND